MFATEIGFKSALCVGDFFCCCVGGVETEKTVRLAAVFSNLNFFFSLCECIYLAGSNICNTESRCYNPVFSCVIVLLNIRSLEWTLCSPVFYKSPCTFTVM